MEYSYRECDIFLNNSARLGAKIVKFLMQSPTIYHQIYRYLTHKLEIVRYFHGGMVLDSTRLIEQQFKVQVDELDKILTRDVIIYRMKTLNEEQLKDIKTRAMGDISECYDVLQIIGKTLTWLTGLKFFVDFLGDITTEEEICVSRFAYWYLPYCKFGVANHSEITTKIIDEYCQNNPQEWEQVYKNNGGN